MISYALSDRDNKVSLTYVSTRVAPKDWPRPPGRIDGALIADVTWPSNLAPLATFAALHHS